MILYTIAPFDEVLRQPEEQTFEYRRQQHDIIQCVNSDGKYTVSRLISTDPRRYLDPRFAPGTDFAPEKH